MGKFVTSHVNLCACNTRTKFKLFAFYNTYLFIGPMPLHAFGPSMLKQ